MAVQYLDNNPTDGSCFGQSSTAKIGFYGKTPAVRPTAPTAITTLTITTAATTTTPWGFATSTQADAISAMVADLRTQFNTLRAAMNTVGLTG